MSDSALGEEVADYDTIHTLGVLPKFPFTLTRSIHVSILKKLEFRLKIVKIIHFSTQKLICKRDIN